MEIIFLVFVLVFAIFSVIMFERNKKRVKSRIFEERRKYEEAFKRYLDDPLNNERPDFNPDIWHSSYDSL